ncbi:MAG TPA: MerR family transcriptional regulator [Candidatus Dormibacteraeota bacterium]|nr:MerR family transcriptional regulator [Candidatus Dormibacteraeota bacterium]
MAQQTPANTEAGPRLKIGAASTLTGVTPGRIRHYQRLGLLQLAQSASGYRYFNATDLVRILQIDLLRSLGMGLEEIAASLPRQGVPGTLREALDRHRQTLLAERDRLTALLIAVERALATPDASAESIAAFLASAHSTPRESLGIFGRLTTPLSDSAATSWERILGAGFDLPVPAIFGRMLLPHQVTEVLERLASAAGNEELFTRIKLLAADILSLSSDSPPDRAGARRVASQWVQGWSDQPLPDAVQAALNETVPRIRELAVLNQGFELWAESISPTAATVLRLIREESRSHGQVVLGVLLAHRRRHPAGNGTS